MPLSTRIYSALLLTSLCAGCRSYDYKLEQSLSAGRFAKIVVLGRVPRVLVENAGPGELEVQFRSEQANVDSPTLQAGAATMQSIPGPLTVILTASSIDVCNYELTIWGSDGFAGDHSQETDRSPFGLRSAD